VDVKQPWEINMAVATFTQVQAVLNKITATWTQGNGDAPDYLDAHATTVFGWDSRDTLVKSIAKGNMLIQPEIIGKAGLGKTANIIVALTAGVAPFPQMPLDGLDSKSDNFLTINSPEVMTIISWIEGGCLP
jgi:hypothetical protein